MIVNTDIKTMQTITIRYSIPAGRTNRSSISSAVNFVGASRAAPITQRQTPTNIIRHPETFGGVKASPSNHLAKPMLKTSSSVNTHASKESGPKFKAAAYSPLAAA
mmetsp:Transcript_100043/g.188309  ORF Transcript_100043/g.188309 Transcript_100043/m.188309 type:complete len:106 (+) Transcript_100043:771-1088(+)